MADDDTSLLPAGMRNNNPLNIKYTSNGAFDGVLGPSQNLDQGDPQAVFQTPQHGMNAAASLLLRKYNSGMTSANSIIAGNMGWTPGNQSAAANVAKTFGADPNEDLNLRDPQRMASFMRALATQEQGGASRAYGPDVYATAASHALGNTGQPMDPRFQFGNTGGVLPSDDSSGMYASMPTPQQFGIQPAAQPPAGIAAAAPQAAKPGFFSSLQNSLSDPGTQYWLNILGAGLSGKDLGTASQQAAQTQQAMTANQMERLKQQMWAQMWQQEYGGGSPLPGGQAGMSAMTMPAGQPGATSAPASPGAGATGSPGDSGTPGMPGFVPRDVKRAALLAGPDAYAQIMAQYAAHPHMQANPVTGELFDTHSGQPIQNASLPSGVTHKQAEEATTVMDQSGRALYAIQQLKGVLGENPDGTITPSVGVQHAIGSQPDIEMWQQLKGGLGIGGRSQDARNQIQQYASTVQNYLQRLEGVGGTPTDAKLKSLGEQINTLTKMSDPQQALQLVHNIENELQTLRQNYQPRMLRGGTPGTFTQGNFGNYGQPQGGGQPQAAQSAIEKLRANPTPQMKQAYDQAAGRPGAADEALGQPGQPQGAPAPQAPLGMPRGQAVPWPAPGQPQPAQPQPAAPQAPQQAAPFPPQPQQAAPAAPPAAGPSPARQAYDWISRHYTDATNRNMAQGHANDPIIRTDANTGIRYFYNPETHAWQKLQ